MANKIEENRNITRAASVIITALMTAAFAAVWLIYYNTIVFRTHLFLGAFFSILIWLILYIKFGQVYRAFKIASNAIGETAFSQFLSIGFADLILYIAGCLVARKYVNVLPGAGIVVLQSVLGFFWATRSKQYFLAHVEPRRCLLIYDADITRHHQQKYDWRQHQGNCHLRHQPRQLLSYPRRKPEPARYPHF